MISQSQRPKVYFRADGNSQMGLGHIYRSLALADMLRGEFDCFFMVRQPLESLQSKIQEIATLIALPEPAENLKEAEYIATNYLTGNEIVVLDGYHFVTDYQKIIKSKNSKLVCIDDIHAYHFVADVVVNHAGGIEEAWYSKEIYTKCYFGLEYNLLQKPFLEAGQKKDYSLQNQNNIFICLGGADPKNDTIQILQTIEQKTPHAKLYVVLGASYIHSQEFDAFAQASHLSIHKLTNLSSVEMLSYMKICGVKICSPSTISYECLSVGGEVYLYVIADNQIDIFNYFTSSKLAFDFIKDYPILDITIKKKAIALQEKLLNGQSAQNLLRVFKNLCPC